MERDLPAEDAEDEKLGGVANLDLHNLLKARVMDPGVPIQLVDLR